MEVCLHQSDAVKKRVVKEERFQLIERWIGSEEGISDQAKQ
jgi:hypothetical protein